MEQRVATVRAYPRRHHADESHNSNRLRPQPANLGERDRLVLLCKLRPRSGVGLVPLQFRVLETGPSSEQRLTEGDDNPDRFRREPRLLDDWRIPAAPAVNPGAPA